MLIFKLLNFVLFVQVEICVTCANDLEAERIRSRKLLAPRRKVAKFGGKRYTLLRMIFTGNLRFWRSLREIFRGLLQLRRAGTFVMKSCFFFRQQHMSLL